MAARFDRGAETHDDEPQRKACWMSIEEPTVAGSWVWKEATRLQRMGAK